MSSPQQEQGSGPSKTSRASLAPSCDSINMHVLTESEDAGTSQLRLLVPGIWEGSGTSRNKSRLWWEPRPVHRRTWKSSELLRLFHRQPQPCSACAVTLQKLWWCHKARAEIPWKPKLWLKPPKAVLLPMRSGGPSTPPLRDEGLLTQEKKSRVPTFQCEDHTAFPVGNS